MWFAISSVVLVAFTVAFVSITNPYILEDSGNHPITAPLWALLGSYDLEEVHDWNQSIGKPMLWLYLVISNVVLVNLLTLGDFPFAGRDEESLRAAISAGAPRLPAGLSESCAELLGSMLARDPRQRATAASVHRHPWLTSVPRVDAADPMVATDISAHLAHLLPPNGAPAGGQLFKGGGARGR